MSQNGDTMEVLGIITKINDVAKGINGMLGNIVEEKKEVNAINLDIQELQNEMKERNDKIIKFGVSSVKTV